MSSSPVSPLLLSPETTTVRKRYQGIHHNCYAIVTAIFFCFSFRRILSNPPPIPSSLSITCKNILLSLMRKDPLARLGSKGAWQVRAHPWFSSLDWDDVMAKKTEPPFKPFIHSELDVGNFAEEFTTQDPVDSPAQPPKKHNELFRVSV